MAPERISSVEHIYFISLDEAPLVWTLIMWLCCFRSSGPWLCLLATRCQSNSTPTAVSLPFFTLSRKLRCLHYRAFRFHGRYSYATYTGSPAH